MGDMANFALEQVATEEIFRAAAYNSPFGDEWWQYIEEYGEEPQEPIPELDLGLYDAKSLDADLKSTQLEFLHATHHPKNLLEKISHSHAFAAHCRKYKKTWEMRIGIAKLVYTGKTISIKQRAWMQTNYIGGTKKFIADLNDPLIRDKLMFHLIRFGTWIQLVADGTSLTLAARQSLQYTRKVMCGLQL